MKLMLCFFWLISMCIFILCNMLYDSSFPFSKLVSALIQWGWKILKSTLFARHFHFERPCFQEKHHFEVYNRHSSSKMELLLFKLDLMSNYRFVVAIILLKTINTVLNFKIFPCKEEKWYHLGVALKTI